MMRCGKSITILLLLTCLGRSNAQEKGSELHSTNYGMTNDSAQFLIRWAETTLGFRLTNGEEILYKDNSAILIGLYGQPARLIATYAFNPSVLPPGQRSELESLTNVVLSSFGPQINENIFYPIPSWLAHLRNVEMLALINADISNLSICENFPLKYLDLRKVHFEDRISVLELIGHLVGLRILVHDESLTPDELSFIKERLPDVKFASKASKK